MGGIMPSPPAMPSPEEQFETQRRLQEQAESKAVAEAEEARRKAAVEEQRKQARRRGRASLITRKGAGGLLGVADDQDTGTFGSLYT